jgi:hypothetical protein
MGSFDVAQDDKGVCGGLNDPRVVVLNKITLFFNI